MTKNETLEALFKQNSKLRQSIKELQEVVETQAKSIEAKSSTITFMEKQMSMQNNEIADLKQYRAKWFQYLEVAANEVVEDVRMDMV